MWIPGQYIHESDNGCCLQLSNNSINSLEDKKRKRFTQYSIIWHIVSTHKKRTSKWHIQKSFEDSQPKFQHTDSERIVDLKREIVKSYNNTLWEDFIQGKCAFDSFFLRFRRSLHTQCITVHHIVLGYCIRKKTANLTKSFSYYYKTLCYSCICYIWCFFLDHCYNNSFW